MSLAFFHKKLFEEVPIYSLVFMRISFGLIMFYQCFVKYVLAPERLYNHFIFERFRFKYYGFEWVEPLPANYTHLLFYCMSVLALMIAIGAFYRAAIILFTLSFTYVFLIDKALYLNHFYMVILYSTLLCFMPAQRYFSFDAYIKPKIKTNYIPAWPVQLLRFQTEVILLYAGIVKINYEWLVRGMPLKLWLARGSSNPLLDYLFRLDFMPMLASYGTVILHCLGAPLLLWQRTRIYVFVIYCCFHLANSLTFQIGIFPYMTIAVTLIFFSYDWPMKLLKIPYRNESNLHNITRDRKNIIISLIFLWSAVQILFPMRCLLYPGNVLWTQEGHDFSWRMKLQDTAGTTNFVVTDLDSGESWKVPFDSRKIIHCRPDMILQYAHFLRDQAHVRGHQNVSVHAFSKCGLNGRPPIIFVNPNVDLAKIERSLSHKKWVMPFDERLR